jgi:hypothetical protein
MTSPGTGNGPPFFSYHCCYRSSLEDYGTPLKRGHTILQDTVFTISSKVRPMEILD